MEVNPQVLLKVLTVAETGIKGGMTSMLEVESLKELHALNTQIRDNILAPAQSRAVDAEVAKVLEKYTPVVKPENC